MAKKSEPKDGFTLDWLEDNLVVAAEYVDRFGPVMQPWLDRFEREYKKLKKPKEVDRIQAMLAADKAED